MKAYDNRNNKNTISCGYCQKIGHSKRFCPTMESHWNQNKDTYGKTTEEIVGVDKTMFPQLWQSYYSDVQALIQFKQHWEYMQNRFEPKAKVSKPRKPSKCGFCGDTAHTRRTCSLMGEFVQVLEDTNRAYRKQFYDVVFKEYGIGIGAFVKYQYGWYNPQQGTTLIHEVDYDSISIGNLKSRWNDYSTTLRILGMSSDTNKKFNFGTHLFVQTGFLIPRKLKHLGSHDSEGILDVIAPAPSIPDEDWFLGQSPAFDWVVKKKSLRSLFEQYRDIISLYHPHSPVIVEEWRKKLK
jgi:hypothetical protein